MLSFFRCLKHNTVSPYTCKVSKVQKSICTDGSVTSTDVTHDTRIDYQKSSLSERYK